MPLTTILFDAGGTLVRPNFQRMADEFGADGVHSTATALADADRQFRVLFEQPGFERPTTDPWRHYLEHLTRCASLSPFPDAACERLRRYHDASNLWEDLMPGTIEALEQLAPRYRLGVVSNANGTVRALMARLGLDRFFDMVVDSQEEGVQKPDPRLFALACEGLGADPRTTLMVGDDRRADGGAAALGCGLHFVDHLPVTERPDGLLAVLDLVDGARENATGK